jgi:hypothetical protein
VNSGCSSLGCAAEKGNANHDAVHSTSDSLIGPVILTFWPVAGCFCARTAFPQTVADLHGQQPFRCRNLKPNGLFNLFLLPSETLDGWLRQFFSRTSPILPQTSKPLQPALYASTPAPVSRRSCCHPRVTCHEFRQSRLVQASAHAHQTLLDVLKRDAQSACRIAKPFFYAIDWLPLDSVLAT